MSNTKPEKEKSFWDNFRGFDLDSLEPGDSHVFDEKNPRTGEVRTRKIYTRDKITGEINREVIVFPNDPIKGKVISKFRNSRLRHILVAFIFLGSMSGLALGYFENSLGKWEDFLVNLAIVSFGTAFVLFMISIIQMEIYARKLRKEMPELKKEKINWKKKVGASLPVFITMIVIVFTLVVIVAYLSYMDMLKF